MLLPRPGEKLHRGRGHQREPQHLQDTALPPRRVGRTLSTTSSSLAGWVHGPPRGWPHLFQKLPSSRTEYGEVPPTRQGPPRPFFRSLSPASSVWSPWREERPSPLPAEPEGLLRVETKRSSAQRDHKVCNITWPPSPGVPPHPQPPSPRDPPTPRSPHHGSSSSQLQAFLAGPCAPSKHMFGGGGGRQPQQHPDIPRTHVRVPRSR